MILWGFRDGTPQELGFPLFFKVLTLAVITTNRLMNVLRNKLRNPLSKKMTLLLIAIINLFIAIVNYITNHYNLFLYWSVNVIIILFLFVVITHLNRKANK